MNTNTTLPESNEEEGPWKVIYNNKRKDHIPVTKEVAVLSKNVNRGNTTNAKKITQQSHEPKHPNRERSLLKLSDSTYSKIFQKKEKEKEKTQLLSNDSKFHSQSSPNHPIITTKTKPLDVKPKPKSDSAMTISQPKKKIALFDVFMSIPSHSDSTTPITTNKPVPTLSTTEKLHSNAQRTLETTFKPKNFVVQPEKKKRKKVLSSFKKRILKERMRMHIQQQIMIKLRIEEKRRKKEEKSQTNPKKLDSTESAVSVISYPSIRIYNFANDINWQDESEKDEIIANIKEILVMIFENHQHLLSSFISLPTITTTTATTITAATTTAGGDGGTDESSLPTAFHQISSVSIWKWRQSLTSTDHAFSTFTISFIDITFKHYESAQLYLNILQGMVIGGDTLHVLYAALDTGEYLNQQLQRQCPRIAPAIVNKERNIPIPHHSRSEDVTNPKDNMIIPSSNENKSFTVMLSNIIQDEDEIQESEDVQEILEDIMTLCHAISDFDFTTTTTTTPTTASRESLSHEREHSLVRISYQPKQLWVEKGMTSSNRRIITTRDDSKKDRGSSWMIKFTSWKDAYQVFNRSVALTPHQVYWYNQEKIPLLLSTPKQNHITISQEDILTDLNPCHHIATTNNTNTKLTFGLGLLSFVSSEEYEDLEERLEIITNIHTIFTSLPSLSFEILSKYRIEKILFVDSTEDLPSTTTTSTTPTTAYHVYVLLSQLSLEEILLVYQALSEITITGQSLTLEVTFIRNLLEVNNLQEDSISLSQWRQVSSVLINKEGEQSLFITDPEIPITTYVHDDIVRRKRQLLQALQDVFGGPIPSITEVCLAEVLPEEKIVTLTSSGDTEGNESSSIFQICLQYDSPEIAMITMLYFDGLFLGGTRVRATMTTAYSEDQESSHHIPSTTTGDNPAGQRLFEYQQPLQASEHSLSHTNQTMTPITTTTSTIDSQDRFSIDFTHLQHYFECVYFEYFFLPTVPTHSLADIDITTMEKTTANIITIHESPQEPRQHHHSSTNSNNKKSRSKISTDPKVSLGSNEEEEKYEQEIQKEESLLIKNDLNEVLQSNIAVYSTAQTLPKIGFHEEPLDRTIPVASEELNQLIKQLLTTLSQFQMKAKQQPQPEGGGGGKGKLTKVRYQVGMKQVFALVQRTLTNPLQQIRCRLIIIAPNTERNEEVDQKLLTIIQNAKACEIPILYALSKRQIGKALQMPIKQTIVGIIDANGAYDIFKKIIASLPA